MNPSSSPAMSRALFLIRAIMALVAGILALIGILALVWILIASASGAEVAPLSIGLVTWCLPWAFVLLGGVLLASIALRRAPKDAARTPE